MQGWMRGRRDQAMDGWTTRRRNPQPARWLSDSGQRRTNLAELLELRSLQTL